MSQEKQFSDEELIAYLDGETDFAPVVEIDAALKKNAALAVRLTALRVDRAAIARSFSGLAVTDRPKPILPENHASSPRFGLVPIAAAAMIALLIGYGAGFSTNGLSKPGWEDYVAAYQALYANSTLVHINQTDEAKIAELKRVAAAIGSSISPDDIQISTSVDYKRAQILSFEGRPLIQLTFLSSTGEPVALCIMRSETGKSAGVTSEMLEGMSASHWSKDGYDYLLIGGKDATLIRELASQYAASI